LFSAAGVPAAPINSVRQALHDPLVASRGMQIEIGGVPMVGSPLNLSVTPVVYREPPPQLGQHSDEIARGVGIDPAELRAVGAIR
jgi:crotonobetainyl-CoA:carnitine CoA-transferase CaiB-like acyl-CoA transferase